MAKVTLVFEDTEIGMTIDADFDQPGVPFEEMTKNPTLAVAMGLGALEIVKMFSPQIEGYAIDDDGSALAVEKVMGALTNGA